jgi:5'-AMP-activated protein kinase catalytic alpha subunit
MFYNRSIDTQNNPKNRKYIGQFVLGERLGQGTFGVVVLGTHQITGEKVAVKILDKEKILQETDKSRLEREIKILKKMRHNNIVHLYDVKETPTSLYIIMEYICGKELFEYIICNKKLQELEACRFYQQIISAIEYLGKIKVVHRDIKPENLLLDTKNNIKFVDFGLSNSYPNNELLITACGSPCYAAPEMINGERYYGLKADIWSSGIVLYAMLCGYLPFEEENNEKLYKKITEGKFKTPSFLSDSAKDFLHRILNVDPKSRITIPQMKKHPWFNLINPKINMSEGLLLDKVIVPIDENIVYKMVNEYKFNGEEIRTNLLLNNHNHITTTYFLILNQKIRNGEKTIGNMKSKEFIKYIHSPTNLLSHYGNDMKRIINARAKLVEKEKKMKEKNSINGLSGETRPGSSGIMKLGSSMEKIKRKDKRETSVRQRKKKEIDKNENQFKTTSVEKNKRNKLQNKYE